MAEWTKAVFLSESELYGPQECQVYHIKVVTPGQFYPYKVVIQELPGCTTEYLSLDSVKQQWLIDTPPTPPAPRVPSYEEMEDFYLYGDPFDGTFSPEDEDDGS